MRPASVQRTLLLAFALAAAASRADAAEVVSTSSQQQQAQSHFQRGIERYDEAEYELSLVEFQRAYALRQSYQLLFNIGQVHYRLRQYARARTALEDYLAQGRGNIASERRTEIEQQLGSLRARTAELRITVNVPGAEVSINGEAIGTSPLAAETLVEVGSQRVTASKLGYASARATVAVVGGDVTSVGLTLRDLSADGARETPHLPATIAWVGAGALAAGAERAGIATLVASRRYTEMRNEPVGGDAAAARDKLDEQQSFVSTLATSTDVLAGASLVTAGLALYFTFRTPSGSDAAQPIRAQCGPRGPYIWLEF